MRLERLRLVNFRQHRDTEIAFGPGLTAVIGPNGAGKSTLLEAVAWAVYGMDAARGNRDGIRWRLAKPRSEVRVELDFWLGRQRYRVARTLYAAELYLDDSPQPVATSLGEVTERLTRALGMSRHEFFSTYFTGQKELAVMAAMKPTERGQFLSRLLGHEKLQLAQERIRVRRNALKSELVAFDLARPDPAALAEERERLAGALEAAEGASRAAGEEAERALRARDAFRPEFQRMRAERERVRTLLGDRRVAEERLRQAVEAVERLSAEHSAAREAAEEMVGLRERLGSYAGLRAELEELEVLEKDAATRERIEAQLVEVARQRDEVDERLRAAMAAAAEARDAAERLDAGRRALEVAEKALADRHAQWVRERSEAESKRQTLLEQYRDLESQRERILGAGSEGACPTCGRPLGAEFQGVLDLLTAQLEEVRMNGQYFRSRLDQLAKPPQELADLEERRRLAADAVDRDNQALAVATRAAEEAVGLEKQRRRHDERAAGLSAEAARLRGGYVAERHNAVRAEVAALEPLAVRSERLGALADRAGPLGEELAGAEGRRAELVDSLAAVERQIGETTFAEHAFEAAEREMTRLEEVLRQADLDRAMAGAERAAARDRLATAERAEREAAERAARAAELQQDLRLHNELDRALGDLRTELNLQMRPDLQALSGEFLGLLTDGRYDEVTLDEDYEMTVLEDGQPQPVVSGGEEDLGNLVLRLAVSQMIAERAGQPLTLLVLDEIFGSLDETRRLNVLSLLRGLEARFPQVVLITHVEGVRDAVDRVLRVRYDESAGSATVTEERAAGLPEGTGADVAA